MYMGPITAADTIVATRPAPSTAKRRLIGVPVLLLAGATMLPWLALNAAIAGVVLGARGVVGAIDYAGTVVLGR